MSDVQIEIIHLGDFDIDRMPFYRLFFDYLLRFAPRISIFKHIHNYCLGRRRAMVTTVMKPLLLMRAVPVMAFS